MIIELQKDWDAAFQSCMEALKSNQLIIYPTDTVYGIGGNACSDEVVKNLYLAKRRDFAKPFSVMVSGLKMLLDFFEPNGEELITLPKYLPGPYSFVLRARKRMLLGLDEISVRVPQHYFCRKLCEELQCPIITTSANLSGEKSSPKFSDVDAKLIEKAQVAVDGGETFYKAESTLVNIREKKILRQGIGKFSFDSY